MQKAAVIALLLGLTQEIQIKLDKELTENIANGVESVLA